MTSNELKAKYLEAKKAKTKYDMCYWMDRFNWKHIPWIHIMLDSSDKHSLKAEYQTFLMSFGYE